MIEINYFAVLVCGVVAMIVGSVWYGPLFGKKWMEATGTNELSKEEQSEMMKRSSKLYLIQFVLVLFQAYVLAWYIGSLSDASSGLHTAFSIWIAFLMPTVATAVMWSGNSIKRSWSQFLIQAGYQLVIFVIFGLILGMWR